MVKSFDHERTGAIANLTAELTVEGGCSAADPEAIAQSIESLADGLWLALLLYPGRITREAARQQTRALLASHFPQHFESKADATPESQALEQCSRLR
jgi:TetR/AcrR family transcriptional repressor of bet genes